MVQDKEVFNDWRLPTIQELLTLVDYTKHSPASNLADTKSDFYWAFTVNAPYSDDAWGVYFYYGYSSYYHKDYNGYVRCVRNGENGLEWSTSSCFLMSFKEAVAYAMNLVAPVYYKG
jgi:hypothetical protein